MKRSFIREILDVITKDTISFAGGLPDAALFPVEEFQNAAATVLQEASALQYSSSQGYAPLREKIAKRYSDAGFETHADEILITTGSQQALNLIAMSVLPKGVTVELPAYLGALSAFKMAGVSIDGVALEADGVDMDAFVRSIARTHAAYLIPDYQNPTGVSYSPQKRHAIAEAMQSSGALLIEDAAYSELFFDRRSAAISAFMPDESFHLGSFSKILVPGLRVGWIRASETNIRRILPVKETLDLHTSSLDQRIINAYWEANGIDTHIADIRRSYEAKKCEMAEMLRILLPEFKFNEPKGGMFIYGKIPGTDTKALLQRCLERDVVYVPGSEFYPDGGGSEEIRFNFSHSTPQQMQTGIEVIAQCLRETEETEQDIDTME